MIINISSEWLEKKKSGEGERKNETGWEGEEKIGRGWSGEG